MYTYSLTYPCTSTQMNIHMTISMGYSVKSTEHLCILTWTLRVTDKILKPMIIQFLSETNSSL